LQYRAARGIKARVARRVEAAPRCARNQTPRCARNQTPHCARSQARSQSLALRAESKHAQRAESKSRAARGIKVRDARGAKTCAARGIKISAALRAESKVTDRPGATSLQFSALHGIQTRDRRCALRALRSRKQVMGWLLSNFLNKKVVHGPHEGFTAIRLPKLGAPKSPPMAYGLQ
jgi:hypothetical protein